MTARACCGQHPHTEAAAPSQWPLAEWRSAPLRFADGILELLGGIGCFPLELRIVSHAVLFPKIQLL
jgi:hypothetical protein